MKDDLSKRLSMMADWPEIPRKQRTPRVIVLETDSSTVASPLDLATSDGCHSSDSNQKPKRRKRNPLPKPPIVKVYAMADVLRRKIGEMGGGMISLAMQKQLSYTDVSRVNSRLSIPSGEIKFTFLSKDEEMTLDGYKENSKRKVGFNVLVIDPHMEETELSFKKWEMDKTCVYNLIHNWNRLVEENGLEAGDTIQLWSFRKEQRRITKGSDLCFALVKLEEKGGVDNGDAQADAVTMQEQEREG